MLDKITIYKNRAEATSENEVLLSTFFDNSSEVRKALMGDDYVRLVFNSAGKKNIVPGSYIKIDEGEYTLFKTYEPTLIADNTYHYDMVFEGFSAWLKKTLMYHIQDESSRVRELSFALTSEPLYFLQEVVKAANQFTTDAGLQIGWVVGHIDEKLTNTVKTISFNGETLFDSLTLIAQTYETEWYLTSGENAFGEFIININLRKLETADETIIISNKIAVEGAINVASMERQRGDDSKYGNRFYVFGGTQNLPESYRNVKTGAVIGMVTDLRLRLPNNLPYIEIGSPTPFNLVEKLVFFEDIFPKSEYNITGLQSRFTAEGYWQFIVESTIDNIEIAQGAELTMLFQSGNLNGMEFKVNSDSFDTTGTITIIPENKGTEENPLWVPSKEFGPSVGDMFILKGVVLPESRIAEAEEELLEEGMEYARMNSKDTDVISMNTNPTQKFNYQLGQKVKCYLDDGTIRETRIQGFTKTLANTDRASYELGDNRKYSKFSEISEIGEDAEYSNRIGITGISKGVHIIRDRDISAPTDSNVYSALRMRNEIDRLNNRIEAMERWFNKINIGTAEEPKWILHSDYVIASQKDVMKFEKNNG